MSLVPHYLYCSVLAGKKRGLLLALSCALIAIVSTVTPMVYRCSGGNQAEAAENTAKSLQLTLTPLLNIYSSRQGIMMQLELLAQQPLNVCLANDISSQLQIKVNRSGVNQPLEPLVVKDNSTVFQQVPKIKRLKAGEKITYRINLKRYHFADGSPWKPGEYSILGTYLLCAQKQSPTGQSEAKLDEGDNEEIPVKAIKPAWFMIMN